MRGRYVNIRIPTTGSTKKYLTLCEVEVYAQDNYGNLLIFRDTYVVLLLLLNADFQSVDFCARINQVCYISLFFLARSLVLCFPPINWGAPPIRYQCLRHVIFYIIILEEIIADLQQLQSGVFKLILIVFCRLCFP